MTASDDTGASVQTSQTVSENGQTTNIDIRWVSAGDISDSQRRCSDSCCADLREKLQVCAVILKIQDIPGYQSGQPDLLIALSDCVEGCITWH